MPAETVEQEWTYIGRRRVQGGNLAHAWMDDEGVDRLFVKGHAGVVGGVYVVNATPDRVSLVTKGPNGPRFARRSEDPRTAEWVAEDGAAYDFDQLRKAEAKAKRDAVESFGTLTLDDVRHLMMTAGPQRSVLLARVLRRIGA